MAKRTRKAERRAQAKGQRVDATGEAIHQAVVRLSPWLSHHAVCARVTRAAACDCGLQAELHPHRWSI